MTKRAKVTVDIYGQYYTIVGEENERHIRGVANIVDGKMREIFKKNPNLDVNKLAVLTAVNMVSEYIKVKEELEILKQRIERK